MNHVDYSSLVPPIGYDNRPITRDQAAKNASPCACSLCSVGRLFGASYLVYHSKESPPVGRPRENDPPPQPEPVLLCNTCFSPWGPGLEHHCTRGTKKDNVTQVVRTLSAGSKERVVSAELKGIFGNKGVTTRGGTIKLATGGKPITTTLGKIKVKPQPFFTNLDLTKFQLATTGMSDNKMLILANFIRQNIGRGAIINLEKFLTERNQRLSTYFDVENVEQTIYVTDEESEGNKKKKITCGVPDAQPPNP